MTTMAHHPHKAITPSPLSLTDESRRAGGAGGKGGAWRAGMHDHDGLLSRRTELVLKELDTLPTLPSVATRLIQLGSQDEVEIREIVRLIEVDPTLTARLLSLCRRAATRTRYPITTVEMAVVMLGLDAVRSLVLSVQVFDWASSTPRKAKQAAGKGRKGNGNGRAAEGNNGTAVQGVGFDRVGFWQHSIAVACCADLIAREHPELDLQPEEAFVCGLVHDLGKLALDLVLPKAYSRVIELSELRQGNIADFEQPIVGLDHHTAGLRLGERWGLPELLRDVMAHHATAFDELPKMDDGHATVVALVGIADALCRKLALGWSGNHATVEDDRLMEQARCAGLNWQRVENVLPRIYEATSVRCKDLGLGDEPSQQLLIESILRANSRLGRLNHDLADANRALEDAQSKLTEARAMACLGEMTAGAAHEMNNPLAVISGRAQGMLKRAENEGDRASAHAIIDASMRLNTLIHRLHRIATPPKPTYQPTDLKPMLEKVIARAKAKAAEKTGVHPGSASVQGIKMLVADGIEPARMDPELFADALTEVLVNALEAGPKGCVEIQAFAETGEDRLVIQITDDGRGMSEHALAHATDPFFSEKPAGRQSGLGLALTHRLLQAQGASLAMQSRLNRGTAVTVMLPRWRWSTHAQSAA